jgi:hypothetical protein
MTILSTDSIIFTDLPLFYEANFKYNVEINDTTFIFDYKWNNVMEFWSVCIYDQYENFLVSVKIVPDWNLYHNMQYRIDLNTPLLDSYNLSNLSKYPDQFSLSEDHYLTVTNIVFE